MRKYVTLYCWLLTLCHGSSWAPKMVTWDMRRPSNHLSDKNMASESKSLAALLLTPGVGISTPHYNVARSPHLPVMSSDDGESWDDLERLKNALVLQRQIYGTEHVETLSAMSEYASALLRAGRWAMAELTCKELLELRRAVLGSEHPDTLKALANYAGVMTALLRWDDALPLLKENFELHRSILGPEHEETLAAMNNYAVMLRKLNRTAEAQSLMQGLCDVTRKSLGANHPQTLLALTNLADVLIEGGQYSPIRLPEAGRLKKEVLEVKRKVLGNQHPDTLDALKDYEAVLAAIAVVQAEEDENLLDANEGAAETQERRERPKPIKALVRLLKEPFKKSWNLLRNPRLGGRR
mmetsp:Transcript_168156/g.322860  ORF Transcript_168156/g.322860 Transcript_168156/m.322860 type:complete len:353 (+) Transcript_168156:62-1120(+)